MLATLVGGFLPIMLKTFLAPPTPDVEIGTVSFKSKMDEVIKNFCQKWPIYDLPFKLVIDEKKDDEKKDGEKTEGEKKDEEKKDDDKKDKKEKQIKLDEQKVQDEKKSIEVRKTPSSPIRSLSSPSYKEPQVLDYLTSHYGHFDGDGTFPVSNNNADPVLDFLCDEELLDDMPSAPVKKCVRVTEDLGENEVDILIYLPDKYDDVWLDEWSDIVSRNSKIQEQEMSNV